MKILVVGDLHGEKVGITQKDSDIILSVGDFCDDNLKTLLYEEIKRRDHINLDMEPYNAAILGLGSAGLALGVSYLALMWKLEDGKEYRFKIPIPFTKHRTRIEVSFKK